MTDNQRKVALFLGAKLVPQKASNDKRSNNTLDYSNVVFPDNFLPVTPAYKQLPFDSDWTWLMRAIIRFYDTAMESNDLEFRGEASHVVSTITSLKISFIFDNFIKSIDKLTNKN